jgi:murein peptide amidase A
MPSRKLEKTALSDSPLFIRDLYLSLIRRYSYLPGASIHTLGTLGDESLPLISVQVKSRRKPLAKILIAAGVHGDEPAGIYALIQFLEQYQFALQQVELTLLPCVNPFGFTKGLRTGSTSHDLNRVVDDNSLAPEIRLILQHLTGQTFDGFFDLHEDNPLVECDYAPIHSTPPGVYLYESGASPFVGTEIVSDLNAHRIEVCDWERIYGDPVKGGIIYSPEAEARRSLLDFESYAVKNWSPSAVTLETPMTWKLEYRVRAQLVSLSAGISAILAKQ